MHFSKQAGSKIVLDKMAARHFFISSLKRFAKYRVSQQISALISRIRDGKYNRVHNASGKSKF